MNTPQNAQPARQEWTPGAPPPSAPDNLGANPEERRVYFEKLSAVLLGSGLDGTHVGQVVAELDGHVAMSGTDPVTELGPVGELAPALMEAAGGAKLSKVVGFQVALGIALGIALTTLWGLIRPLRSAGSVTVDLTFVVMLVCISVAMGAVWWKGSQKLIGRSRGEKPSFKWYFLIAGGYVLVTAVVETISPTFLHETATPEVGTWWAVGILGVSAAASAALLWMYLQFVRVSVPGNARHLRRLHWGVLGR